MRVCQVVHGFPPTERTGVENYTQALSRALARAGHRVEVFVPRRDPHLADLALRREERGGYAVNWITTNHSPANPTEALLVPELKGAFAAFLERERPEIVHFQHLIKLGIELPEAAREQGLPTVYTAHDYYPICHRFTLLRPDLSRCDARNDSRACARCDLALAHLNTVPGLGDYQVGVLPDRLPAEARARLQAILADRAVEGGVSEAEIETALKQRTELDQRRSRAYQVLDLVLAPSRFLIEELVRGGFERERIVHQPLGFDNADLADVPPVRAKRARPVRFAFVGGMSKHKGVHVLLEAFEQLHGRAELSIWGHSTDQEYVRFLRERCGAVGAQWRGAYERTGLPAILSETDALVVPSIWVENYPLVIHEGFSARRPVLASRLGALEECVRDGVDGLLFAPGDAADLARVMRRCVEEPELLPALADGIGPVKEMDTEARELEERYMRLVEEGAAGRRSRAVPPSLHAALARYEALSALPARELFVRVLSGLDELREAWGTEVGGLDAVDLLALGLGEGSEAQDRLREARNEITWLRSKKDELAGGKEELMALFEDLDRLLNETRAGSQRQAEQLESSGTYVRRKEQEVTDALQRLRDLELVIAEKDRHIREVEGHLNEAGRYIRHKEQEFRDAEAELRARTEDAQHKEQEFRDAEAELRAATEDAQRKEQELAEVRAAERQRAAETRSVAQVGLNATRAQARLLWRDICPLLEELHALLAPEGKLQLPVPEASFPVLLECLRNALAGLRVAAEELRWRRGHETELAWRRERMQRFVELYQRSGLLRVILDRTRIGKKVRAWDPRGSSPT